MCGKPSLLGEQSPTASSIDHSTKLNTISSSPPKEYFMQRNSGITRLTDPMSACHAQHFPKPPADPQNRASGQKSIASYRLEPPKAIHALALSLTYWTLFSSKSFMHALPTSSTYRRTVFPPQALPDQILVVLRRKVELSDHSKPMQTIPRAPILYMNSKITYW